MVAVFLYSKKGWSCYDWASRHLRPPFVKQDHLSLAPCQLSVLMTFSHRMIDVYHSSGGEDDESCVDDAVIESVETPLSPSPTRLL